MTNRSLNFDLELKINAPPERVFAALTTGIAVWWGPEHLENRQACDLIFEAKVGGRFYEKWDHASADREGALLANVVAIKKHEHLRLSGQFGMSRYIILAIVTLELERTPDGTLLKFSHQAVGDCSTDKQEHDYKNQWHNLLEQLRSFVDKRTGDGVRHEPALDIEPTD